jgi:hypothetical protein
LPLKSLKKASCAIPAAAVVRWSASLAIKRRQKWPKTRNPAMNIPVMRLNPVVYQSQMASSAFARGETHEEAGRHARWQQHALHRVKETQHYNHYLACL